MVVTQITRLNRNDSHKALRMYILVETGKHGSISRKGGGGGGVKK